MVDRFRAASSALVVLLGFLVLTSCKEPTDTWHWVQNSSAPKFIIHQGASVRLLSIGIDSWATQDQKKVITSSGWYANYDKNNKSLTTQSKPCDANNDGVSFQGDKYNDCDHLSPAPPVAKSAVSIEAGKKWGTDVALWDCAPGTCKGSLKYTFVNMNLQDGSKSDVSLTITWDREYDGLNQGNMTVDLTTKPSM